MKKEYRFYIVSHGGTQVPFWKCVKEGMEAAEKLLNIEAANVKATYFGSGGKYSIEELENKINDAAKDADGMAVTMTDAQYLDKLLREIIETKKIPVIALNVPDYRAKDKRIPYLFYVGMDEYACGTRLAERMLAEFKPKRAVVVIHEKGHKGLEKRAEGIKNVLEKNGIPTNVLIGVGEDFVVAVDELEKYWAKYPDTDAFFTVGSVGTPVALNFLHKKGLIQKVKLVVTYLPKTIDSRISDAIKDNIIICAGEHGPFLQGFLSIYWLYQYCKNKGNIPREDILLGPIIVDKYNVGYVDNIYEKIIKNLEELLDEKFKKGLKNKLKNIFRKCKEHKMLILTIIGIIVAIIGIILQLK